MQHTPRQDAALIEGWRRGDPLATNRLFRNHVEALRRFVNRRTSDDPDDVIQQSILAGLEARDRLREPAAFRAFLFSCARYTLFARWRIRGGTTVLGEDLGFADDPETIVTTEQNLRDLREALELLPGELEEPLRMYYFEDLSGRCIARALAIPEGTVRSRVRRGLAHLRRSLGIIPRCRNGR